MPSTQHDSHPATDGDKAAEGGHVTVRIPPLVECLHPRVWQIGGKNRIHPLHRDVVEQATLVTASPDWGYGTLKSVDQPLRVTFHERAGTFADFSRKAGRTVSGRGPHEQANFEEMEVDPVWVNLALEGAVISWEAGGTYTPDFIGLHVDDGVVTGEVKADMSYFVDRNYAPIVANAERTCAAVGITFKKVVGTKLHGQVVRRQNVRRAFIDRFTHVPPSGVDAVANLLAAHGTAPLGRVEEVVAPGRANARGVVHALLCARGLSFDLNLPVTADTIVGPAPVQRHSADIRALELSEAA
ncbi:hypothetical protein [Sphingomonas aerophila]|uniref:TnsA endonuclease N-terminal domain-containing protein n=1 Tax=Sphingomonas aerophila TaxID=1344948 RepID=A0A7W9BFV5_9SPHN|nr:hypothetical protein [Sphingomonas aerophila]MBB5716248.1 hypothetical protein [Sphingomonas aerophila]